jgi:hypothetical protein
MSTDNEDHALFADLRCYIEFYEMLAQSTFQYFTPGTLGGIGMDSYIQSSLQETLDSIRLVIRASRIGDAYALLRKFHDAAVLNIYNSLYLKENYRLDNLNVEQITKWIKDEKDSPRYEVMIKYIDNTCALNSSNAIFNADNRFSLLRKRCNNRSHYNSYAAYMENIGQVRLPARSKIFDQLAVDIKDLVVLHLGYTFYTNWQYLSSSDYMDYMNCNMTPPEGCQNIVATYIQEFFNSVITPFRPEITLAIKRDTPMLLE